MDLNIYYTQIFNTQMLILSLAVAALTVPIKSVGDYYLNDKPVWSHAILPLLSLIVGLILGLLMHNIMGGLIASLFSQLVYTKIKDYFQAK